MFDVNLSLVLSDPIWGFVRIFASKCVEIRALSRLIKIRSTRAVDNNRRLYLWPFFEKDIPPIARAPSSVSIAFTLAAAAAVEVIGVQIDGSLVRWHRAILSLLSRTVLLSIEKIRQRIYLSSPT